MSRNLLKNMPLVLRTVCIKLLTAAENDPALARLVRFVRPAQSGRRLFGDDWLARMNESGRSTPGTHAIHGADIYKINAIARPGAKPAYLYLTTSVCECSQDGHSKVRRS
jgi:hypothetical protein